MQERIDYCKQYFKEKGVEKKDLCFNYPLYKTKAAITDLINQGYSISDISNAVYFDNPDYLIVLNSIDTLRPADKSLSEYYGFPVVEHKIKGCDDNIKLLMLHNNCIHTNHYYNYIVENQTNRNRYLVIVRYTPDKMGNLGDIQGIAITAFMCDAKQYQCIPMMESILFPKGLLTMGIVVPDLLPMVIHMVLDEGKSNAGILVNGVNEMLYKEVLETFGFESKELDFSEDVLSHIQGTCNCYNH